MVTPGEVYSGSMDYNDDYLSWYRKITRLLVSPPKESIKPDYKDRHYYNPTATDYEMLTQMSVYTYNEANKMLKIVPDDGPLALTQSLQRLRLMSLETLQKTQQGHLIADKEGSQSEEPTQEETQEEETQEEEAQGRCYNLRNRQGSTPNQDDDVPESSSRTRKTKRTRRQR